jgi:hypothetical protein
MTEETSVVDAASKLFALAARSFLAYVVDCSTPSVASETDERLFAALSELRAKERALEVRCRSLAEEAGARPSPPAFALRMSYFNFVRPETTARRFLVEAEEEIAAARAIESRLPSGEDLAGRLKRLASELVAARRSAVATVEETLAAVFSKTGAEAPPVQPKTAGKP